jgi:hypothetical protein
MAHCHVSQASSLPTETVSFARIDKGQLAPLLPKAPKPILWLLWSPTQRNQLEIGCRVLMFLEHWIASLLVVWPSEMLQDPPKGMNEQLSHSTPHGAIYRLAFDYNVVHRLLYSKHFPRSAEPITDHNLARRLSCIRFPTTIWSHASGQKYSLN